MLGLPWDASGRMLKRYTIYLFSAAVSLAGISLQAGGQTWVKGDVYAGVGNGQYNVYSNSGVYKETITDSFANGYTTGCAFTSDLTKLYTTNFSNDSVTIFDGANSHGVLKTISTSSGGSSNESLVFDSTGKWYVGHADGAHGVIEYSAADAPIKTFFPTTEDRGTDWIDLAKDNKTLFYTSEAFNMLRFDLSTSTQLTNYAGPFPSNAYAHRLLAPFDGSGGLLVSDTSAIYRLDKTGAIIKTYNVAGSSLWFSLNLDPNGTSFWAGDLATGNLYRFNIATGAVEVGPINTLATNGNTLGGVCVRGEITATTTDTTPPVVVLDHIVSGPPKQVVLATHDTQSGLKTLSIVSCDNCTAVNGTFKVGTNGTVFTTATKTDQTKSSTIKLTATDVAGNSTTFDPIDFEIQEHGVQTSHTVLVSPKENVLMIANGAPGVRAIQIRVNRHILPVISVRDNEGKRVNLAQFMNPLAKNEVTVKAYGAPGAKSWIVITEP